MEFVHQNQVAHMQCGNHGARGNFERLKQEGAQDENRHNDGKQTCGPIQPPRLAVHLFQLGCKLLVLRRGGDALLHQLLFTLGILFLQSLGRALTLGPKIQFFRHPIHTRDGGGRQQQRSKIAFHHASVPSACIAYKCSQDQAGDSGDQSSTCNIAKKASWGTSTDPICFMRFLPAFCFSKSLRLRLMSPP